MPVEQKQADQVALTARDDPQCLAEDGSPCIRRQDTKTSHTVGDQPTSPILPLPACATVSSHPDCPAALSHPPMKAWFNVPTIPRMDLTVAAVSHTGTYLQRCLDGLPLGKGPEQCPARWTHDTARLFSIVCSCVSVLMSSFLRLRSAS